MKNQVLRMGDFQRNFLIASMTFCSSGIILVLTLELTRVFSPTLQVGLSLLLTILTMALYLVRYYNVAAFYRQEESITAMCLSFSIAGVGFAVIISTVYGPYFLAAYCVLLVLAVLKEAHTNFILRKILHGNTSIQTGKSNVEISEFMTHERDCMFFEVGFAVFVFWAFTSITESLGSSFGVQYSPDILTPALIVLLCYVSAFLLNKIDQFAPLYRYVLRRR